MVGQTHFDHNMHHLGGSERFYNLVKIWLKTEIFRWTFFDFFDPGFVLAIKFYIEFIPYTARSGHFWGTCDDFQVCSSDILVA